MPCQNHKQLIFLIFSYVLFELSGAQNSCSFPPQITGGQVKVLKLLPLKTVKYSCQKGYHLWGQEIVTCDPDNGGWPEQVQAQCIADSARNKIALTSSRNSQRANIPLVNANWDAKHQGKSEVKML